MSLKYSCFTLLLFLYLYPSSATKCEIEYKIMEEIPKNTLVGDLPKAFPDDKNDLSFTFPMEDNEYADLFRIENGSGRLLTAQRIDRESWCDSEIVECELDMKLVKISSSPDSVDICNLKIIVIDINDNAPFFESVIMSRVIDESLNVNSVIHLKGAHDRDAGVNTVKFYELQNENDKFALKFDENGLLVGLILKSQLDHEEKDFYNLTLVAKDNGEPQKSGTVIINLSVKDINDNKPQFTNETYNVDIYENASISSTILTLSAKDNDSAQNGKVGYKFLYNVNQNIKKIFLISESSGEIILKKNIDYEKKSKYSFKVVAFDYGFQPQSSIASVNINVLNINDNKPDIFVLHVSDNVSESDKIGDIIARISVSDKDDDRENSVNCSLSNSYFKLNSDLKEIMIAKQLDFEKHSMHNVCILCHDYGEPQLHNHKTFQVQVHDENDNPPIFKNPIIVSQYENKEFQAFKIVADDHDSGINSEISYQLWNDSVSSLFNISQEVGLITTDVKFDRENVPELQFKVLAIDMGNPPLTGTGTIILRILDVNDQVPTFPVNYYEFHVKERQDSATFIGNVEAHDLDIEKNGQLFYWISNDNESSDYFNVVQGRLKTKRTLTYSTNLRYDFTVCVKDHGIPPLSSCTNVTVFVDDINDNSPYFEYPTLNNNSISIIYELTATNKPIAQVIAFDEDDGKNAKLSYFLRNSPESPDLFRINHSSGEIMLVKNKNVRAQQKPIKLRIIVKDHGDPSLQNTSTIFVTVDFGNVTSIQDRIDLPHDEKNKLIGTILGIVTACLIVIVIIVICIVRKIDDNRRRYPPKKLEDVAMKKSSFKTPCPQVSVKVPKSSESTDESSSQLRERIESETTEMEEEKETDECLNNETSENTKESFGPISLQGSCAALL